MKKSQRFGSSIAKRRKHPLRVLPFEKGPSEAQNNLLLKRLAPMCKPLCFWNSLRRICAPTQINVRIYKSDTTRTYYLFLANIAFISNKLREIFTISFRLAQETRVGKYSTTLAPIKISPSVRSSFPLHLSIFANKIYKPMMKTMQHTIVPTQNIIDAIVPSTFSASVLLFASSFIPSWYT